jgi:hypothetical protein
MKMPPCGVWTRKRVPADKVAEVVAAYNLDEPKKVEKIDNHNGTFDVVATFTPCANGSDSNQSNT